MSFKKENSSIIMIGKRKNELGGSIYYSLQNELGKNLPKPNLIEVKNQIYSVTDCIEKNIVVACHDISTINLRRKPVWHLRAHVFLHGFVNHCFHLIYRP